MAYVPNENRPRPTTRFVAHPPLLVAILLLLNPVFTLLSYNPGVFGAYMTEIS